MNILLIKAKCITKEHPLITPPLGLMYLSAYIKQHNPAHNFKIIDMRMNQVSNKELARILDDYNPQVVGISAVTMEAVNMHEISAIVKETLPECKVVAGGPHPSSFIQKTLSDMNIDYLVLGEGEVTFYELLENIEKGGDIKEVKGLAFRNNNNIYLTPHREYIQDLDTLPFPDWDLINIEEYSNFYSMTNLGKRRYMALFTSRSCPYRCIYCHNIFGKGFRGRSPENVLQEIKLLYYKYNIRDFEILDDIFNFDRERTKKIFQGIIDAGLKVSVSFPNGLRTDLLDYETLRIMRDGGVKYLSVAVESASPRIQKLIKKNLRLDKVREMIDHAVKLGIFTQGFFMIGFPTETEEEIKETLDFAFRSPLHTAHFFIVTPFEGTELYDRYKELIDNVQLNFDEYSYYKSSFKLSQITKEKLARYQFYAYSRFYLNPIRIIRIVVSYFHNSNNFWGILFYFKYILRAGVLKLIRRVR